jgi:ribosome-binding protein aMBF1 (putative translation factor)
MKTKNFQTYLKKRLSSSEIVEIQKQAEFEADVLRTLQEDVSEVITDYMSQEKIGFNELARRLDASPTQISKIRKGKANLTLASLAHIFALLRRKPRLIVKKIKN